MRVIQLTRPETLPARSLTRKRFRPSRRGLWAGRILTLLVTAILLGEGLLEAFDVAVARNSLAALGFPPDVTRGLGLLTLAIAVLYIFPPTALLGAVLLTALLGGAVAAQLRIGEPVFSHVLSGVYIGMMAWAGLWLRDARVRRLLPQRR